MQRFLKIFFPLFLITSTSTHATTWDEPWADGVIKGAGSFVLGSVISTDEEKGIQIVIIKTLGGIELKDTVLISNFYLLTICSSSGGHGAEFQTEVIDSCYFFIAKNAKGEYCIATPTSGYAYVVNGHVIATFRHSYHQASVPVPVYEKAMTAIFNHYHNLSYDKDYIQKMVNEYLGKPPAGFDENEINTFFMQHVALETVYHLKLNINGNLLIPFLNDKNFHNQVSAARAMGSVTTEANKLELLKAIGDSTKSNFVRVMCVWSISRLKPKNLKNQLRNIEKSASNESVDFGGNIMDPRVCTHIPSLKQALDDLLKQL